MARCAWLALSVAVMVVACGGDGDGDGGSGGTSSGTGSGITAGSGAGQCVGVGLCLDEGQCRSDDDCADTSFEFCLSPGESVGCGACEGPPQDPCADDDACKTLGDHYICEPLVCPCDPSSGNACRPGCMDDTTCAVGLVCGATHRCEPQPCQVDQDCPDHHQCTGDGECARRSCTSDADCDGYCVEGACFGEPGFCTEYPV